MTSPLADHLHSDPGDGRSECPTCGKWVWLVTHSCKGISVTPSPLPTDEDAHVSLAKILTGLTDREWAIATAEGTDHLSGYFDAAERILAAGFRRSVVSTPSEEMVDAAMRTVDPRGLGGRGGMRAALKAALEASAVSAPPTITDAALQRLREAVFAQSQRERSTGARGSGLYYPSIDAATTILRAALGGEDKVG